MNKYMVKYFNILLFVHYVFIGRYVDTVYTGASKAFYKVVFTWGQELGPEDRRIVGSTLQTKEESCINSIFEH